MIREEFKRFIEENNYSINAVARAIGISAAAISQYLNGIYKGNATNVEEAVRTFLIREKEKLRAPKREVSFVETSVARKVFEVARLCHLDCEIGVIYGDAGVGKTVAIKEYARRQKDVILIEADLGYTAKVLFSELHRRLGMDGRGTIHDMFEDVVSKLKDSGRLIIIDEAEHLPYRALELLRRVYDKAGVGILLVGMPRLISNLRGRRGEYAQLYSRIGVAARLTTLKEEDVQKIVGQTMGYENGIWKCFYELSNGNTRVLTKLLLRSMRVAGINDMQVNAEIVKETAKMLVI